MKACDSDGTFAGTSGGDFCYQGEKTLCVEGHYCDM